MGGIAGHFAGRVIPPDDASALAMRCPNNSSGLVILAEDLDAERLIGNLKRYHANVVTVTVGDELSGEIAAAIAADVTERGAGGTALPAQGAPHRPTPAPPRDPRLRAHRLPPVRAEAAAPSRGPDQHISRSGSQRVGPLRRTLRGLRWAR